MARGLKVLGLTGGIGVGKSTVAGMLAARGVPVVDADQLAREVVAPGWPAHAAVAGAWPEVMRPDGAVDRERLGKIVFSDPAARKRLEAILHPRIQALATERLEALAAAGHRLAIYEASLLVETGRQGEFDGLIVVAASPETQRARLAARGLAPEEAERRIAAQLLLADKLRVATYVIHNEGDLDATRAEVERLLAAINPGPGRP